MVQLLQISDTHLFAEPDQVLLGVPTYESLQLVVADALQRFSDAAACVLTGDLAQDGSREGYQHLVQSLAPLTMPKYALPGNHDDLELTQQVLATAGIAFTESFACGGWYIIMLNSVAPDGGHHGLLAES